MGPSYRRRGKMNMAKRPKYVVLCYDKRGNERIYYRKPESKARKIRLRGPLLSKDFWTDYESAVKGELKPREKFVSKTAMPDAGTFARLVTDYYSCAEYGLLSKDTRYRRRLVLDPLREKFGKLPAAKMTAPHIRRLRDQIPSQPDTGNAIVKALRQVFKFGVEYGHVTSNPAREVSILKSKNPRGYHTWTPDEQTLYKEKWPVGTQQRLAFDLLLYTGTRRSDAVILGPGNIKESRVEFTPGKTSQVTGRRLSIPIHPNLQKSIDETGTGETTFLLTSRGHPWKNGNSFGNVFKDYCRVAGLENCSAHGLRKAAAVMLIEAGCTAAEAASITGHDSLNMLEHYARERDRKVLATSAIQKLVGDKNRKPIVPQSKSEQYSGTNSDFNPLQNKENIQCMAPRTGLEPVTS